MTNRKHRPSGGLPAQNPTQQIHRAFRRMAFMLANLVCGIWLVLFTAALVADEQRPEAGSILILLLVSGPLAYLIPYGLVRGAGFLVAALKKEGQ